MKNRFFIPLIIITLLLSACESFLEPEAENTYTQEELYTASYWEGILLNAYDYLPVSQSFNEDLLSDDAVTNDLGSNYISIATGNFSAVNYPHAKWVLGYENLYYINLFLDQVDEIVWSHISEERNEFHKQRLKGEAYGLRAYIEFNLLKYHAGYTTSGELSGYPIIRGTILSTENWKLPRNSFQECLDSIYADCERAITLLPDNYLDLEFDGVLDQDYVIDYNKTFGIRFSNRINAAIIKALRSRIALFAASPALNESDNSKWQLAANYSAEVLTLFGGIDNLDPDGVSFYLKQESDEIEGVIDPEIIWKSRYTTNRILEESNYPPSLFGRGRTNPSQNLVDVFPMKNGYPITVDTAISKFNPLEPFAGRDPRLEKYILIDQGTLEGEIISTLDGTSSSDAVGVLETSTRSGYFLKKFLNEDVQIDPGKSLTSVDHFAIFLRYTEVLLNYAEAVNQISGPDGSVGSNPSAREVIGAIRERAGIDQPDAYLLSLSGPEEFNELIKNERRIELCFENHRYWDIRRWKDMENLSAPIKGAFLNSDTIIDYKVIEERKYQDYMIYGPIPYNEVIKYEELLQNDGY